MSRISFRRFGVLIALALTLAARAVVFADEIIYDNTSSSLTNYVVLPGEFGDELVLAGTARVLKEISFEYYAEFTQRGNEFVKVRLYTNEKPYDLFRNEPTRVIYESGLFGINPGYNALTLFGFNTVLPDVVTFTVEFRGLDGADSAGLLLYDPPTVGISWDELWWRDDEGAWRAVFIPKTDNPKLKAKVALRLTAVDVPRIESFRVGANKRLNFSLKGLSGANYVLESSRDLNNWTLVTTQLVPGASAEFSSDLSAEDGFRFYRVRVP